MRGGLLSSAAQACCMRVPGIKADKRICCLPCPLALTMCAQEMGEHSPLPAALQAGYPSAGTQVQPSAVAEGARVDGAAHAPTPAANVGRRPVSMVGALGARPCLLSARTSTVYLLEDIRPEIIAVGTCRRRG